MSGTDREQYPGPPGAAQPLTATASSRRAFLDELRYHAMREAAEYAIVHDDPEGALKAALRCISEADELLIQARAERTAARQDAEHALALHAEISIERSRLASERQHLQAMRTAAADEQDPLNIERRRPAEEDRSAWELRLATTARQAQRSARPTAPNAIPDPEDASLRPNPYDASTPADFMTRLRQFKIWSGNPGYRQIAAGSGRRYTASALHAALKRDAIPRKQELVDAIVQGCGGTKEDRQAWATAWRRLAMQPASGVPIARVLAFPEAPHASPGAELA